MDFEVKHAGHIVQIPVPRNDQDAVDILRQARQWHINGDTEHVAASDTALKAYFTASSVVSATSKFVGLFKATAGAGVIALQQERLLERLFRQYPTETLDLFSLPLTQTQMFFGSSLERMAAAAGHQVHVIADAGNALTRAALHAGSFFDSPAFKVLCDEDQTAEEREDQWAGFGVYREMLDQSSNPLETLMSLELSPRDLFRFFRYLGVYRETTRRLLPVVFAALCEAVLNGAFESMPKHTAFLVAMARREPSLRALLATGDDKVYLRVDGPDGRYDHAMSRFLLATAGPYFEHVLSPEEWEALDVPVARLAAPRETAMDGDMCFHGPVGQDARVVDLSGTALNADMCSLLSQWLESATLPCPRGEMNEAQLHAFITQIAGLSSYLHPQVVDELATTLGGKVTADSLLGLVTMGLRIRMPNLLSHCLRFMTTQYGDVIQIMSLPSGSLKLKIKNSLIPLPRPVAQAVNLLLGNVTHLSVQRAMQVADPVWKSRLTGAVRLKPSVANALQWVADSYQRWSGRGKVSVEDHNVIPSTSLPLLTAVVANDAMARQLQVLDLTKCDDLTDAHLLYMIRRFPNIRTLMLGSSAHLTGASLNRLSELSQLDHLRLTIQPGKFLIATAFDDLNLEDQFAHSPGLRVQLIAEGWEATLPAPRFFQHLNHVDVTVIAEHASNFRSLAQRCAQIRLVSVSSISIANDFFLSRSDLDGIASSFPCVRHLQLPTGLPMSPDMVQTLSTMRFLRSLSVGSQGMSDVDIAALVAGLPDLEDLFLALSSITSVSFGYLSKLKSLRRLVLAYNDNFIEQGVSEFRVRRPDVELTLYLVNRISAEVLAPTTQRTSAVSREQQATMQAFFKSQYKGIDLQCDKVRPLIQSVCHILVDLLMQNRCATDYTWPDLGANAVAVAANAVIPALHAPNLETFRVMLQTRLKLAAVAPENRSIEIPLSHVRALVQLFQNAGGVDPIKASQQGTKSSANAKKVESWAAAKAFWPSWAGKETNAHMGIAHMMHAFPGVLQEGLSTAIELFGRLAPVDYRAYLSQAFPQMNPAVVDGLFHGLSRQIHGIARNRAQDIGIVAQSFSTVSLDVLNRLIALVRDPEWSVAYTQFLDRVCVEGDRAENHWTDQQRLALALGGLLEFASLAPVFGHAARHEQAESKHD